MCVYMLGGREWYENQTLTCGLCADSILGAELNLIVEHSVGVWRIRELVGGVRKYHRPYKKRERETGKQDYAKLSGVLVTMVGEGFTYFWNC